ncbi:MAG: ATP-binding protein [Verrucomicrobiia bacterium]|jgi:hypothetical protein
MKDLSRKSDAPATAMPAWADEVISLYQSNAANQFILYGNIDDRFVLPLGKDAKLGSLTDFLEHVLMPRFDVVLSYDVGNGIRVEKGGAVFGAWPAFKERQNLPKSPRPAIETLTHYFRYASNLAKLGKRAIQIGCWIRSADLVAPAMPGGFSNDLNALAMLMRDWGADEHLSQFPLVTCLLVENLNDLHSLLANSHCASAIKIPLPTQDELKPFFNLVANQYPIALKRFKKKRNELAAQLSGATMNAVENLLKLKEYRKESIKPDDLVKLKKELVEKDCNDLVEFIQSDRTLDDMHAQDKLKERLREDIAMWKKGDTRAMPMGYLICGPVGTGKTYMVECLAGDAGVPVVKIKNFRDKWIGSTEGNLETIFRLLQSLGRCFVFIDEADQALGKREGGSSDGGLSGRVYSMFAKEMSNPANRGRIVWILASSRPDLIEVDLKRPGRVDVKIPIFPTTTPEESFHLIRALCKRLDIKFAKDDFELLRNHVPDLVTPGAAEAIAIKVYRIVVTKKLTPREALRDILLDYQHPVAKEIMDFQIGLAVKESTDMEFVPDRFRLPQKN